MSSDIDQTLAKLIEMHSPEELHLDLAEYLVENRPGIRMLNHPLVQCVLYAPHLNKMMNMQYEQKKSALEDALSRKDYTTVVFLHERPYRLEAFMNHCMSNLDDRKFWRLMGVVWSDTMNSWQAHDFWEMMWETPRSLREHCMNVGERYIWRNLAAKTKAYRGVGNDCNVDGFSWTTDIEIAKKFSRMYGHKGSIYQAMIPKESIYAFFDGRGESELVVRPRSFKYSEMKKGA